jgi:DNA-binding transcriptional ArsR family regulator
MDVQVVRGYLDKILGIQTNPMPWANAKALPFLLRDRYEFFTISLLGVKRLLMVVKDKTEETPAVVRKHMDMAKQHWDEEVIYIPQVITSFNRTRLIEQRVPFIVPGRQLYLPDLGVALSENFKRFMTEPIKTYSPATQTVLLEALNNGVKETLNGTQLAEKFGYSLMTISRVLSELEETGLASVQIQGRERKVEFNLSKRELWEKAKGQLRSPVKMSQTEYERNAVTKWNYIESGLTALAHYSHLAEPTEKTYATDMNPALRPKTKADYLSGPDWDHEHKIQLEVWDYDPRKFAKDGRVDPFSLYLCLRGGQDERVEAALEEMMEKVEW